VQNPLAPCKLKTGDKNSSVVSLEGFFFYMFYLLGIYFFSLKISVSKVSPGHLGLCFFSLEISVSKASLRHLCVQAGAARLGCLVMPCRLGDKVYALGRLVTFETMLEIIS
jgi:hypothetical protein